MAIPLKTYAAADPSSAQIKELLGLRVKVEYETEPDEENAEQSVKAAEQLRDVLSDDWLDIDPEEWEKSGNYYYYQTPLRSGESVILMESVRIPPYIDSASAGITFHIRIAAEVFPLISDMEKISLSDKNVQSHITMREFEYDPSELRAFTNNQTVVPGQRISKIVQIHVYDERAPVVDQTDPLPRQDPIEDKTVTGSDETTEINPGKDPVPYIDVTVSTNTPVAVTGNTIFNNNGNQTMNGSTKNISDNSIKQLPAETPTESRSLSLYGTTGSTSSIFSSGKAVGGRIREFLTGDDSVMVMWLSIAMAALLLLILYAVNINTVRAMCVPTANSIMSPFEIASNSMPTLPVRTAAFLSDQDQKINRFSPGEIRTDVTEQYDPPELSTGINVFRKAVRIRNTGNAPCYVRVFLSVSDSDIAQRTWFAASEEDASEDRYVLSTDYMTNLPYGWQFNEADQYCYYTEALQPGEETIPLIYAVKTVFDAAEDVRPYEIIVYQEAVQTIYEKAPENSGLPEYEAAWRAHMHHGNE